MAPIRKCSCNDFENCRTCRRREWLRKYRQVGAVNTYITRRQREETAYDIKLLEEKFPHLKTVKWKDSRKRYADGDNTISIPKWKYPGDGSTLISENGRNSDNAQESRL